MITEEKLYADSEVITKRKTTTIYELLGLVKDGKAPKIIKYKGTLYEYASGDEFYFSNGWSLYREFPENGNCLNDEVEILEEEKKIPEKLKTSDYKEVQSQFDLDVISRINQVIDYLKSKGE